MEKSGELNVGDVHTGMVTSVRNFGAFVRVGNQEGLVHISQWQEGWVDKLDDLVKKGDEVQIKVLEPDRQGRLRFSRKAVEGGDEVDES